MIPLAKGRDIYKPLGFGGGSFIFSFGGVSRLNPYFAEKAHHLNQTTFIFIRGFRFICVSFWGKVTVRILRKELVYAFRPKKHHWLKLNNQKSQWKEPKGRPPNQKRKGSIFLPSAWFFLDFCLLGERCWFLPMGFIYITIKKYHQFGSKYFFRSKFSELVASHLEIFRWTS